MLPRQIGKIATDLLGVPPDGLIGRPSRRYEARPTPREAVEAVSAVIRHLRRRRLYVPNCSRSDILHLI